ncbi:2372_t:CDS:2 [Cetraspora pellucida]|uniref:2372_t:CDS:1 n=1 Tax=Cetraspora pellucida TaxID=1433469 RepID=A0A9N8ZSX4_9GLOM|nr:2372_t:CDS:2 [Cetraspora pellucida]
MTKLEKMMPNAKCAAILAFLHKITIFLVGSLVQYTAAIINRAMKKGREAGAKYKSGNIFILARHPPEVTTTSNDYAMYDQSQTHETVHFEDLLHKHVGAPEFLRKYYVALKNTTLIQHGYLFMQRVTGEAETYELDKTEEILFQDVNMDNRNKIEDLDDDVQKVISDFIKKKKKENEDNKAFKI